jgi:hypothetical protein
MKAAHQAAAYDRWFRAEIGAALIEADDPAIVKVVHGDVAAVLRLGDTTALRALAGKSQAARPSAGLAHDGAMAG